MVEDVGSVTTKMIGDVPTSCNYSSVFVTTNPAGNSPEVLLKNVSFTNVEASMRYLFVLTHLETALCNSCTRIEAVYSAMCSLSRGLYKHVDTGNPPNNVL